MVFFFFKVFKMSIFKIRSNWKFIVIVIGNLKDVIINRLIGIFGRLFIW